MTTAAATFDLTLPPLQLESGDRVSPLRLRGWWSGAARDLAWLTGVAHVHTPAETADAAYHVVRDRRERAPSTQLGRQRSPRPVVLLVHALTGDARAGGDGGWWSPLVGAGRAIDTDTYDVICFNNLGSCYGTSGPVDPEFPTQPDGTPAVLTTWDAARAILAGLDALGIGTVHLAAGGSTGAMIVLALAVLAPGRLTRLGVFAGSGVASAWIVGWNHVARQILALSPTADGLAVARQLAMMTYRAEPGLDARHGRRLQANAPWQAPPVPYQIATYLDHQGQKLAARFDRRAYLASLDLMDHHDWNRPPRTGVDPLTGRAFTGDGHTLPGFAASRIHSSALIVAMDTDVLYQAAQSNAVTAELQAAAQRTGATVARATLQSPHGHDAFLMEWPQLDVLVRQALALPAPPRPP